MRSRPFAYWVTLTVIVSVGVLLLQGLTGHYRETVQLERQRHVALAAVDAQRQLTHAMSVRVSAVRSLHAFLLAGESLPTREAFHHYADELREYVPTISALVFVDDNLIIRGISPIEHFPSAVGVDVNQLPVATFVRQVIAGRRLQVSDPQPLAVGEIGIIASAPLYREARLLGLAQGVFVIDDIVAEDLEYLLSRFDIQLHDRHGRLIWGPEQLPPGAQSVPVVFGDNHWVLTLAMKPFGTGNTAELLIATLWAGGGALVLLLIYGVHRTFSYALRLNAAVASKTRELRQRNQELESEIRQRQKTEAKLRRSKARLKEAQHIARLGSWEWAIREDRVTWSDELHRIVASEATNAPMTGKGALRPFHPEDQALIRAEARRLLKRGGSFEHDIRVLGGDGSTRHLRCRGTVVTGTEGRPERLIGTAQDVTEQKIAEMALAESERKYRIIMESASDGIAIADTAGQLLDTNRQLQNWVGYTREEMLGSSAFDFCPEGDRSLEPVFAELKLRRRTLSEHWIRRRDGSTFPVEIACTPVELNGRPLAMGIVRDLSARKAAEALRERQHEELERLVAERTVELTVMNRELEAFSYSISHDLRAPLRAINGFSQILEEDYGDRLDDEAHRHLERIAAATNRMGRLIDGLLQLSKTLRIQLHRESVDLSSVAQEIADELRLMEPDRRAEIHIARELQTEADPALIRSLLQNLLSNAWKFTRERDPGRIEVGCEQQGSARVFFVRDNGIGLDPVSALQLFRPFQRLHQDTEYEGNGIGLATVQRIAQRHGGRAWVEGAQDEGATFYFTLGPDGEAFEAGSSHVA